MKQYRFIVLFALITPLISKAQLTSQVFTTNSGGGTTSGGSYSSEVNTNQFGGRPSAIDPDSDLGVYLSVAAFNLESGIITVNTTSDGSTLNEAVEGTLMRVEQSGNYDTLDANTYNGGSFAFNPVFLGDYLINVDSDPEQFVATYFGDAFLWEEAQIVNLAGDSSISISIVEAPTDDPTASGVVTGTIEEDFPDDENARIDSRRRAKRRKCGLRRRRTGGRSEQDVFELIAYGETNDNGEFEYGFLPEGTYRFFVEYPGIPLDESTFVQFDIGESGVTDDSFVLAVFATDEGISIELVLGITTQFFTNFNIYPNPTQEYINVDYDKILSDHMTWEIVSLEGKIFKSGQLINGNQKNFKLDVSQLRAGVYLLKFIDRANRSENELILRFIKK